jgi:integrase
MLSEKRFTLPQLHEAYGKGREALQRLRADSAVAPIGELVERWFAYLPTALNKQRQRYAPATVTRYKSSWNGFFDFLPAGNKSKLTDIDDRFLQRYRTERRRAVGGRARYTLEKPLSASTLNRDLAALGAFLTWAEDVEGLSIARPRIVREREAKGRDRWLDADEIAAFERACDVEWWPFFATLLYTGARLGEAKGLRGADVKMTEGSGRISIHSRSRRVKTAHSQRVVPVPDELITILDEHFRREPRGQDKLVFPGAFQSYPAMRRVWNHTCKTAEIGGATPHDCRHTFGVHAAIQGVPIVRLQKLMGHASPMMTMRYMQHAPESFMDEDGAAIGKSLSGARPESRRRTLRIAV